MRPVGAGPVGLTIGPSRWSLRSPAESMATKHRPAHATQHVTNRLRGCWSSLACRGMRALNSALHHPSQQHFPRETPASAARSEGRPAAAKASGMRKAAAGSPEGMSAKARTWSTPTRRQPGDAPTMVRSLPTASQQGKPRPAALDQTSAGPIARPSARSILSVRNPDNRLSTAHPAPS